MNSSISITMFSILIFAWYLHVTSATYVISVYGDVYQDREFFIKTYPWIIDNIGGDITVDYYLLGSGRYTVPQMCALSELKLNTFIQAQFLKCEADGNDSETCLCAAGIDPQKYRHCVLTRGSLASQAATKYSQLGIDARPVVEVGYKNTVFGVEDSWYLKKICTIFGDNPPRGCIKPFDCNGTESYSDKSSIVQFDCQKTYSRECSISISCGSEKYPYSTPFYTTTPRTTTTVSTIEAETVYDPEYFE